MIIIWSDQAIEDVSDNVDYLETNWSEAVVENFKSKVDSVLNQLEKGTVVFKPTEKKDIYQIIVVKQITLFYRLTNQEIILLRFWNNHQNPKKFKF
ncbi:MAG: type II toxin-antitoxin system RelE/ParE family toxin [Flavobacteriales bacterium]|nr:type II toxin-antitoxin system RelE/ParE family toxin [Flavobacteriales bacterium]MBS4040011.1 type II toxin-antitoxin system RelE/ParE family toxin [Flavobacteriales bacterium]